MFVFMKILGIEIFPATHFALIPLGIAWHTDNDVYVELNVMRYGLRVDVLLDA